MPKNETRDTKDVILTVALKLFFPLLSPLKA